MKTKPISNAPQAAIEAFNAAHWRANRPLSSLNAERRLFFKQSFGRRFARCVGTVHEYGELEKLREWFNSLDELKLAASDRFFDAVFTPEDFAAVDALLTEVGGMKL